MLVVAKGPILKVLSRSDMIWLRKHKLGASRMLRVPDGDLKDEVIFDIIDQVVSC